MIGDEEERRTDPAYPSRWRSERPGAPARARRGVDPDSSTAEGRLLTELRTRPGEWLCVATDVPVRWWFSRVSAPLHKLKTRGLVEHTTEPTRWFRAHVWARALVPDELPARCLCGRVPPRGGLVDPDCPIHGIHVRRNP